MQKLKNVPTIDGRKDFTDVDLKSVYCTEREFAAIVGISPAMSNRLKKYGVLVWNKYDGINLKASLKEYLSYKSCQSPTARQELQNRLATLGYDIFL